MLQLTGVAIVNIQGTQSNDWLRETITILPDVPTPLQWAITHWSIPVPTNPNFGFTPVMSIQQWAPFAGLSSIFDKDSGGVDAGYAVDAWRPTPFDQTSRDPANNPIGNVFKGINVDVAVRNNKANLTRVSYQITLLGKIVFAQNFN